MPRSARTLTRTFAIALGGAVAMATALSNPANAVAPQSVSQVTTSVAASSSAAATGANPAKRAKSITSEVRGAPVAPNRRVVRQSGGSAITLVDRGDAARHWTETSDGRAAVQDAKGVWRYATGHDSAGQLVARTGSPAVGAAAAPAESLGLRPTADRYAVPTTPLPALGFSGTQRTLVILGSFTDRPSVGTTAAQWSAKFFGASGSVRAHFKASSYNQLDLAPATESQGTANDGVVGWVNLGMAHPNYYDNIGASAQQITKAAIQAADPYVNYASYDTNADGVITPNELHITVIAAGYEGSYGGPSSCAPRVWGHRWAIGSTVGVPVVDGKAVGGRGYTQFGEQHCATGDNPGHMATIGIMAHEFGHDLGWPDLYDTDGSSEGVGEWSLMASGSWGSTTPTAPAGDAPTLPDAWSKYAQGWINPTEIPAGTTSTVSLQNAATSNSFFRMLPNAGGPDWPGGQGGEYFLVENRQATGLDIGLPGCGVLVYHVNEARGTNSADADRLVDVVEADGLNGLDGVDYRGGPGDAWHGVAGHTRLDSATTPNTNLNNGTTTAAAMTQTGGCAATMSATLTGGSAPTIVRPPNNDFANRQVISGASGVVTGTSTNATSEAGEPVHADAPGGASVWYRWTAPSNGTLTLTTSGSSYDTLMGLYTGSSVGGLTEIASNDDENFPSIATSKINGAAVQAGVSYAIAVDGFEGDSGSVRLAWQFAGTVAARAGTFTPVTPSRILNSRTSTPFGPEEVRSFPAVGVGGVPATGVDAVVLNVTAVGPTASGWATVYPAGGTTPVVSNLNFTSANPAIANLVVVKVGTGGAVSIHNKAGQTHFLADVVGWYATSAGTTGSKFTPQVPARVLDTRAGGSLAAGVTRTVDLDLPPGAKAAVMNVTVTRPTSNGFLTVWPSGLDRPGTSNVNWKAGETVPNLVYSPVSATGTVDIYNSAGNSDVLVDVVGWFAADGAFIYHPLAPYRAVDTRNGLGGIGSTPLGPNETRSPLLSGGLVPAGAGAIIANTTVAATTGTSWLTVWPFGDAKPTASNLNWVAGKSVPNLVSTKLSTTGRASVSNAVGTTHVIMDIAGWYGP